MSNDAQRRLVWSAQGGRLTHYNASLQVVPDGDAARLVWIADFLPHAMRDAMADNIAKGLEVMKRTLERG